MMISDVYTCFSKAVGEYVYMENESVGPDIDDTTTLTTRAVSRLFSRKL